MNQHAMRRIPALMCLLATAALPVLAGCMSEIPDGDGSPSADLVSHQNALNAPGTRVAIDPKAQLEDNGAVVRVGVRVRCKGGEGSVFVFVQQFFPEVPSPVSGSGFSAVVCDGQQHETNVSVFVPIIIDLFDTGQAFASASLSVPSGFGDSFRRVDIE